MTENNNKGISLYKFLENNSIKIPEIQRDYAQGREGKEFLREKFLYSLKKALDNNQTTTLDFIYGSNENGYMRPLDGQQRLTTLWLLHWYIAYRAKKTDEKTKKILEKFSYETRISSRDFCKMLVTKMESIYEDENNKKRDSLRLSEIIINQTGFYTNWLQDPSICSMLRMIAGTDVKNKKSEKDIIDGLDEIFRNTDGSLLSENEYMEYWKELEGDNCPISFFFLNLNDLKLTDDLYIKMNARGKPLTDFENFKADFIGFFKNNDKDKIIEISRKFDTDWTDIFWTNQQNGKIDEIFLEFINRYLLGKYIVQTKGEKNNSAFENNNDEIFDYFYLEGNSSKYVSFRFYEKIVTSVSFIETFERFFDNLKKSLDSIKEVYAYWDKEKDVSFFIPQYTKNDTECSFKITLEQRFIFFAISKYLEKQPVTDIEQFKNWLHFCWNMAAGADLRDTTSLVTAIRKIDNIPNDYMNDIWTHLQKYKPENSERESAFDRQLEEEIEKAKYRLDSSKNKTINEAEKDIRFKGTIRFLFTGPEGYEWSLIEKKWKKLTEYKKYSEFIKVLLNNCTDWKGQVENVLFFDDSNLKKLLIGEMWKEPVHNLLTGMISLEKPCGDEVIIIKNNLSHIDFDYLVKCKKNARFYKSNKHITLAPPYERNSVIIFDDDTFKRQEKLRNNDSIEINSEHFFGNKQFLLWGRDITFTKDGNDYIWKSDNTIWDKNGKKIYDNTEEFF